MLALVAWRNVWRNKTRSLVLLCSVILGIWGGTFIMAFSWGMVEQYVNIAIEGQVSHIQLHNPEYKKDKDMRFTIRRPEQMLETIRSIPGVKAVSARSIVNGMAASPSTGAGVSINGIVPADEDSLTHIGDHIIDGNYFGETKRNPVIIGEKLAHKLKAKTGSKIILTFQDTLNNITSGAFRVTGIYRTSNSGFDEMMVFVRASDLNAQTGQLGTAHEIAVLLNNNDQLPAIQAKLQQTYPNLLVENWKQISPELSVMIDSLGQKMYAFIVIILLALAFGIVNTMLMAVLERIRELGILMAIGMNRQRVFFMIMLETLYLSLIGGPAGVLLAWITVHYTGNAGIDLSAFGKGLSAYGMGTMVHPALPAGKYFNILAMVFITAIIAAIYPSIKALRLKPATAIRKI